MDVNTNSPMVSSRHMTEGVAKQAKTSSVLVKCVRCGSTMGCPRHCPHMYTWPLWVFAAEVCVEWQAAISTILVEGGGGVKITGSNGGRQGGGEQGHEEGYMQEERAQRERTKGKGGRHQSDSHTSLILPTLEFTGLLVRLLCVFCKLILAEITAVTPRGGYERATPHTTLKTGWLTGSSHQTNRKSPWVATIQTNNGTD